MKAGTAALLALLAWCAPGCHVDRRHFAVVPERNQALRVQSGDRLVFDLDENMTTGYSWTATCDDDDVDVTIRHVPGSSADGLVGVPGVAKVEIRIRRGYDGPSAVRFRYRRPWERDADREFVITLFKRVGDTAFWE